MEMWLVLAGVCQEVPRTFVIDLGAVLIHGLLIILAYYRLILGGPCAYVKRLHFLGCRLNVLIGIVSYIPSRLNGGRVGR